MKPKLLISACLCGKNTKYNGGNNLLDKIQKVEETFELILVCPEVMGGLPTPRDPSELQGERIVSHLGKDVTEEFNKGAYYALELARKQNVKIALLKESSPSCGKTMIYDGTFTGTKIPGQGVAAKLLTEAGIEIYTEKEVDLLLQRYSLL